MGYTDGNPYRDLRLGAKWRRGVADGFLTETTTNVWRSSKASSKKSHVGAPEHADLHGTGEDIFRSIFVCYSDNVVYFRDTTMVLEGHNHMEQTAGMAAVNGTHLYYEKAGSGHPLVLMHGFTLNTQMWNDQFDVFAQHYQVIRYDMRGSGKSAMQVEEPFTEVEDLRALLDTLGVSRTFVLGLSRGGSVAIDFALAYPERTNALVLVDPALGGWNWSKAFSQSMHELEVTAQTQGVDMARQRWLAHPFFLPAREQPALAKRLAQIVSSYSGWSWLHQSPEQSFDLPAPRPLQLIKVPTLLIMGERDIDEFQAIANHIARTIPRLTKLVLPGVGHMSNMEAPEAFNEAVSGFLGNLEHHHLK